MKKKQLLFLVLSLFFVATAFAQKRVVKGTVVDDKDRSPIPGATVRQVGTKAAALTDGNGQFTLTTQDNSPLEFSFIGFKTQRSNLADTALFIRLQADDTKLGEVVITGYGGTTKKAFTGAATTINREQFKDIQATSITDVLQGNSSGVLAISSSGQPGEEPTIRIRGVGSFNASSAPLILLDGAPYSGSLNSINPADIETITILKDASSTSIYGSRGANGIVQITSRRGKGKPKLDFAVINGYSSRAVKEYRTVNERQYYELTWEALRNDAIRDNSLLATNGVTTPAEYATKLTPQKLVYNPFDKAQPFDADGKILSDAKLRWNEDWLDEVLHNGLRRDYTLSISGSDAQNKTNYFIGGGFLTDEGLIKESNFIRYSGRMNLNTKITDWFEAGVNSSFSKSDQNYPYQGNAGASNVLSFARNIAPIYPVHLVDFNTGEFILDGQGNKIYDFGNNTATLGELRSTLYRRKFSEGQNVAATTSLNPISYSRLTASGQGFANIRFHRTLSFNSTYTMNYNSTKNDMFWNPFYGDGTTSSGYSGRFITNFLTQNFTNTITYNNNFNTIHHVNVVAGSEAYKAYAENVGASTTGFTFAYPREVSYGTTPSASGSIDENRLESYFTRLSYDFKEKYHLTASLRTDGSTRFDANHRWGVFYAVGASWNMNEEGFFKQVKDVSLLKLKASYGTSGNQALSGSFPYLGTYSSGANIGTNPGAVINTVGNPFLSWEKTSQVDIGIDFGFLRDRITGSFDYFDRRSNNLLFDRPLPSSSGVGEVADNSGGVKNVGWEFDITTINIQRPHFTWKTMFNITKLRNEILEVAPGTTQVKGRSWYDYYMKEYAGVDPTDGEATWYVDKADGTKGTTKVYGDATQYNVGNRLQDYTGGISSYMKYKNFDFSILASFGLGGEFYDGNYQSLMGGITAYGNNASVDLLNRWQSTGKTGSDGVSILRTTSNNANSTSTRFLYDHTFMRVRNITIGYNVSSSLMEKIKLRNARVYFNVQNAFTYFPNAPKGADPDSGINAQASSSNTTPNRFVSFGINVGI
ncbi:TonB-linked SusC/RagA family outer membrane protein [Chitinophaga skermanii]|uniref:TonB-linked SusC/RagA family outer membrane protein n=1 Tax=Chitinophaga skermanii TaxID=331697 RepID=A0A327QRF8_9BACT|nr:SusC/RagA family TonB-linked outer membrane protein [Chitinophaga skermanii]RAJ06485.1 TonB-linked SusC/RagA family outer membrane protein [Chitinophaga skermanii]